MSIRTPWSTNDELNFVKHLATIKPVAQREPLLKGYLSGLRRRVNWAGINHQEIREAAEEALEFLQ